MSVTYTEYFEPNSSLVDAVYYDENADELTVVLDEEVYRYSNVPKSVFTAFRSASSAGRFYTPEVKRQYGPGEYLGSSYDVDTEYVTPKVIHISAGGPSGLTVASDGSAKFGAPVGSATGPHISLVAPSEAPLPVANYVVEFVVDAGGDLSADVKKHRVTARSLSEAVAEVETFGKMLGLDFEVVKAERV